jgi:hypothetical protein
LLARKVVISILTSMTQSASFIGLCGFIRACDWWELFAKWDEFYFRFYDGVKEREKAVLGGY